MSVEDTARVAMQSFVLTKRSRCLAEKGPYDLAPQLDVVTPKGRVLAIIPDRDAIVDTVALIAREHGWVSEVVFLADAYGRTLEPGEGTVERGDLAEAFAEGDMAVSEMLTVSAIEVKSGTLVMLQVSYTYDDEGMPVFGDVDDITGTHEGAVVDALRSLAR